MNSYVLLVNHSQMSITLYPQNILVNDSTLPLAHVFMIIYSITHHSIKNKIEEMLFSLYSNNHLNPLLLNPNSLNIIVMSPLICVMSMPPPHSDKNMSNALSVAIPYLRSNTSYPL